MYAPSPILPLSPASAAVGEPSAGRSVHRRLAELLGVERLPLPGRFTAELLEARPVPYRALGEDDPAQWEVCELHHPAGESGVLALRDDVRRGAARWEPLLPEPVVPDPRSGVFAVDAPGAADGARFVVVSHGGRKGTGFKARVGRVVDAQQACPRLRLDTAGPAGGAGVEVRFEPVAPSAVLYGWVSDFLIFPHAGAPVLALGRSAAGGALLARLLGGILHALDERGCVLPDLTPRNLVYAWEDGRLRVGLCDLEHGAARAAPGSLARRDGDWAETLARNALEYLFALRHAPPAAAGDPLCGERLRELYRVHPVGRYFEETLARAGLPRALGCAGIPAFRDLLLHTFFREPQGMEAFFLLRGVWDRVPSASYAAALAAVVKSGCEMAPLARALAAILRMTVMLEYLNGVPEGIHFLRSQGLENPSSEACARMVEAYLSAAGGTRPGAAERYWLETIPRRLRFAPLREVCG